MLGRRDPDAPPPSTRDQARLIAGAVAAAVVVLLAVVNLDKVEVDYLFGSSRIPLVVVIVGVFLLGGLAGFIAARRRG